MPKHTLIVAQDVPFYAKVVVEADTLDKAASKIITALYGKKAMADPLFEGAIFEPDYTKSGAAHIIRPGTPEDPYPR